MRRRRFFAWGLGVVACAAGCGTERFIGGAPGLRSEFSINPAGRRWDRVGQAFAGAARASGYQTGAGTKITLTGLPALAAAELNHGQTPLYTATPLSRLAGDVEVVVVPGDSRFKDFDEFGAHLLARPGETLLAGGPQGAPDHLLFGLIAKGLGADTRQVDYTGYPGSQEVAAALLSGEVAAGAGLLADWRESIGKGRVRALAVSCAVRVPDLDVPTLLESGVRVDFADWTAAFGPDDMPDESREAAIRMCEDVTGSTSWQAACRASGWISIPLSGDDFRRWLASEVARTRAVLRDLGLVDTTKATTCWGSCGNGH
ncbi:putative tricarboxylic transport membrane protein [Nonomuraea polychroma]|uniref:Putative tricarboxylic transport membrane protein n=1 Tax=Nonomuraea polychroma TaxID=46176 RepID=A0A438MAK2_9ACTN|nr:tripartite tricarboxylate transporter substrate-binding protein [Nonomuraea polychroma]RVX42736.1 putative tricarboxylic transport membrane protein [Nonomuraea polychroma]